MRSRREESLARAAFKRDAASCATQIRVEVRADSRGGIPPMRSRSQISMAIWFRRAVFGGYKEHYAGDVILRVTMHE